MTTFFDELDEPVDRDYEDVTVCLSRHIGKKIGELEAAIDRAKTETEQRLAAADPAAPLRAELEALLAKGAGSMHTIRIYQMPGNDWLTLTSKYPPQADSEMDLAVHGFDFDRVCLEAAGTDAEIVDGETLYPIEPGQWIKFIAKASGYDLARIRNTAYGVNVVRPQILEAELGKALEVAAASESN
ncbi:hypothetical protein M2390_002925 [Mycetocola sp. BIGb0189]|uniref:hypothetical protein n=1 Tax=Mycetocola sp. BIGb0189 TaxID=2940604 RepID=UPI002166E222|nr:hypothetical protein [Mycetocola sp. BIGb0189]MCS4277716.1 hypothetical protein [Mycetocola sp. BIGb0189]